MVIRARARARARVRDRARVRVRDRVRVRVRDRVWATLPLERAEGVAIERVVQQQHVRHHLEPGRDATEAEGDERPG